MEESGGIYLWDFYYVKRDEEYSESHMVSPKVFSLVERTVREGSSFGFFDVSKVK